MLCPILTEWSQPAQLGCLEPGSGGGVSDIALTVISLWRFDANMINLNALSTSKPREPKRTGIGSMRAGHELCVWLWDGVVVVQSRVHSGCIHLVEEESVGKGVLKLLVNDLCISWNDLTLVLMDFS